MEENKELKKEKKIPQKQEDYGEVLVRIFGCDIPGSKKLYPGLTNIKGVSWSISNALCLKLGYDRSMRISELTKDNIAKIESSLRSLEIPGYMKNRRSDLLTGEDKHLLASDLDITKEFDIKRLKKIRSYRGIRHMYGLPVRGQRTRSHFRNRGTAVGVKKKAK